LAGEERRILMILGFIAGLLIGIAIAPWAGPKLTALVDKFRG